MSIVNLHFAAAPAEIFEWISTPENILLNDTDGAKTIFTKNPIMIKQIGEISSILKKYGFDKGTSHIAAVCIRIFNIPIRAVQCEVPCFFMDKTKCLCYNNIR